MKRSAAWIAVAVAVVALVVVLWPAETNAPPTEGQDTLPQRIICMAPNIAETVFALGAGDRVVGVSSYTEYPPEAAALPKVGALYNPNLEKILSLKPDLVIIQQKHESVQKLCADRGIRVLVARMEGGVERVLAAIEGIGLTLADAETARDLLDRTRDELEEVVRKVADRPAPLLPCRAPSLRSSAETDCGRDA